MADNLTPRKKNTITDVFRESSAMSSRSRTSARQFRISGQGFQKNDIEQASDCAAAAASGSTVTSLALPAETTEDVETVEENPMLVAQLLGINKTLERQIETLRLRFDFDTKHHEAQKVAILAETGNKLNTKNDEIKQLKQQLSLKDARISKLTEDGANKDSEISECKGQIETLFNDVESAKDYANTLVSELATLTEDRKRLEHERSPGGKSQEISAMNTEVEDLKKNLAVLERELLKAREIMSSQTGKLRFMESEKATMQLKFKEELAKVTHSMRLEVEKMRDVMRQQWEEMRALREQNDSMGRDIKDIRNLIIHGSLDDDARSQHDGQGASQQQPAPPMTARGSRPYAVGYTSGALKPSLPILNKSPKRNTSSASWRKH